MTKIVNLYYGSDKPLVCGSKVFTDLRTAQAAGRKSENYVTSVAYEAKAPKFIPFTMDNFEDMIEFGDDDYEVVMIGSLGDVTKCRVLSTEGEPVYPVIAQTSAGWLGRFKKDGTGAAFGQKLAIRKI